MKLESNNPAHVKDLVENVHTFSHTSWCRGYVSRVNIPLICVALSGWIKPYKGKFGIGYKILNPSWESTQYCRISYYIKPNGKTKKCLFPGLIQPILTSKESDNIKWAIQSSMPESFPTLRNKAQ